ncbi:magnesium transporter [Microbacterium terrae]|uniref:Magnesium transport protein CorA n=1 Tax=Microbacterium terrae TaxID=69369 RepID=A0A0M2GXW5_9MICO|nr:magnesium and cobalt transport protein CorA [Microbacterium terrae]KJL38856.1 Magnesium transport protein CorA [Microbacterium terrae]MBP1077204.1 magnesium transporter [Microbacterium terrae]GLJ99797.1 magnesium transport protein CorA [Microbacterium terrae]
MAVIDNAIYVDGHRVSTPDDLASTSEALAEHGGFAWIGLYRPGPDELGLVAGEFDLHPLAVEDALVGHQRSKLERYGDTLFLVLRPARYLDDVEAIEFGEVDLFVGRDFVVAVRHAESPDLARVRARLESAPELLGRGTMGVLYAILDQIVDEYAPVMEGLENDIDEIEAQLFSGDPAVTKRIYDLAGEVMETKRAIAPLQGIITAIRDDLESRESVDDSALELRRGLRDVLDHVLRTVEKIEEYRQTLQNALTVHATLVAQRQNETSLAQSEQTKRISSWAAIIFAPSLITGIYGMNFVFMPELAWPWGYPLALLAMAAFAFTLYRIFKKRSWL